MLLKSMKFLETDIKNADNEKITVISIDVPSGLNPNTGNVVDLINSIFIDYCFLIATSKR